MKKVVLFFAVGAFALVSCDNTCNAPANAEADSVVVEEVAVEVDSAVAVVADSAAVVADSAAVVADSAAVEAAN